MARLLANTGNVIVWPEAGLAEAMSPAVVRHEVASGGVGPGDAA